MRDCPSFIPKSALHGKCDCGASKLGYPLGGPGHSSWCSSCGGVSRVRESMKKLYNALYPSTLIIFWDPETQQSVCKSVDEYIDGLSDENILALKDVIDKSKRSYKASDT